MEPAVSSPPLRDTPEQEPALAPSEYQSQERVSAYGLMVVEDEFKGLDSKKDEMHTMFEQIQDKASSVLEFTLRWDEIDEQFGFLEKRAKEVEMKEESVRKKILELEKKEEEQLTLAEERERTFKASITERLGALAEKESESHLKMILEANLMSLILQMQNEQVVVAQLNAQEELLGFFRCSMMQTHEEVMRKLEARKEEVASISKSIDEKFCALEMKVKDFGLEQTAETNRRRKEAELMETSVKQLDARENELNLLNDTIAEKATHLEKEKEHFQVLQQAEASEIEVKTKFLELMEKELEDKEKQLDLKQQTEARDLQVKRNLLEFKEKELEEREKQLELKQRNLEELSVQVETRKRSRSGRLSSAEKGIDADSLNFSGKKHKHNSDEEKHVLHGKTSSASASKVKRREVVVIEDLEPFTCPDPDFNDFNNTMSSFAVGQVWALYDPIDYMPRYYAQIKRILTPRLSLRVKWLESVQTTEDEEPIPACGRFKYGNAETRNHLMFSHEMHHIKRGMHVAINPRKGETWALFRDWTKTKSHSGQGQHTPSFRYDFVEVLSEFNIDHGIGVAYLGRVEGFTSVYKHAAQYGLVQVMISSNEMLRFSHRVPSFKLTGSEKEGVPAGSFELDPAAVPRACLEAAKVKEENI